MCCLIVDSLVRDLCRAVEIEGLRFHDLRHEATSRFFERGLSVTSITGHKGFAMLQRYTHLCPQRLAEKLDSS
jgi:integrase